MLFTWNTQDLCIVFRWWHVSGTLSLIISLLAVVALGAAYEALRSASRRYETFVDKRQEELPSKQYTYLLPLGFLSLHAIGMKLNDLRVEMDPLLRQRLSFGQDATRSKLARGHMLSRRFCMRCRAFMHLC